jgi:hypothetical protein
MKSLNYLMTFAVHCWWMPRIRRAVVAFVIVTTLALVPRNARADSGMKDAIGRLSVVIAVSSFIAASVAFGTYDTIRAGRGQRGSDAAAVTEIAVFVGPAVAFVSILISEDLSTGESVAALGGALLSSAFVAHGIATLATPKRGEATPPPIASPPTKTAAGFGMAPTVFATAQGAAPGIAGAFRF